MKELHRSALRFVEAQSKIPGGVNSPARAFKAVGGTPPFMKKAKGAHMWDIDGNEYIDYIGSWGPMILGHGYPAVIDAVRKQLELGTSFGTPTEIEIEMADLVIAAVPSIEMVRMVNSGTEAVMSAIRLARGYTDREKIIKFSGCYHGHSDMLLAEAGSGVASLGIPGTPGVPAALVEHTLTAPFNDSTAVEQIFAAYPGQIAAVVIEPVAGNMGLVPPRQGFLEKLRAITEAEGAVLIFDEVMTGFRLAYGGAQARLGVTPDMTCLGKIIGGGMPVGAYGGKREIMECLAPAGKVYQAGTLSGNPVAMQAGVATLKALRDNPKAYEELEHKGRLLSQGIADLARELQVPVSINLMGSMFCVFFTENDVYDYASAKTSDLEAFKVFFHTLLEEGVYFPPAQFEACFISLAHSDADLRKTLKAVEKGLKKVREMK
ncbi:glutamate-1-semialdehyde-2,1-aminomutase [bacterium (Candidatus Blackallbacteria) CG17_big_fil_post_rev_8_21_14_2_50_48_46]|uniref:Glutamate-1-semialdehyde 2,1-aminomutase n=1 Tax=bacterium (Candidatus Blackallbacteria) CG17_big_fil_post_rev_8_21_14_2_50_48_46 TaxID=2014261 RepID=A0A2M7G712_9BACT|nr:MAG: glutamate-1-semialdehyde-2,1-aminomutase [bacterium (Candidatus Blackallbacteria) CG18_big_fil_WC_8_21_14_2_50_49_26]PIW17842.1 MAG: glutamate-1-semialdehyde-2,1-aminomutase [bacterium (Candidatus Blackallbacteria) CG17_big_fil_post_rev_8_21_14_2_50_48_46]PIW48518.1 MAG: glutamate-1-semialdehyde-2,1-aminomutase [bacterium (Candidatus Blackallbacteria) CG13_big_fil_rev_8_21_14_2_50_49_14]